MTNMQDTIRNYVLLDESDKEPLVFQGLHGSWTAVSWSLGEWGEFLKENSGEEFITVRAGLRSNLTQSIQWEADCKKIRIPWETIAMWDESGLKSLENGLASKTHWLYYDYKYMDQILSKNGQEIFTWHAAGFPDRNGCQSTLWIGTKGAYTPFHYDTYGCNLITQVYGSKTWTLFPPKDTEDLLATRIPYEESSVYSRINLMRPTPADILQLSKCTAFEVTLKPGDVLYVPPKWWHFVVHDEMSISVNTWIDLPEDTESRLEEAVLKTFVCAISNLASVSSVSEILNPNETEILELDEKDINEMLRNCSSELITPKPPAFARTKCIGQADDSFKEQDTFPPVDSKERLPKISRSSCKGKFSSELVRQLLETVPMAKKLTSKIIVDSQDSFAKEQDSNISSMNNTSPLAHLLNAIGHPTVLKEVANRFLHTIKQTESVISMTK